MAAKKKELSATDKFYLDNHPDNEVVELADFVGNSTEVVQEYLDAQKAYRSMRADGLFATKMRNGKPVASVSTEAASMVADANRSTSKRADNPNMIFHPRGKK